MGALAPSFQAFARQVAFLACQDQGITLALAEAPKMGSAWAQLGELVQQKAQQRYKERESRLAQSSEAEKKEQKRRMVLTEEDFVQMRQQKAAQLSASLPLHPRAGLLEFIHRSVFEYCTAQQLLRLLGDEADCISEEELEVLLDWTTETFPEVLMFVHEHMEAAELNGGSDRQEEADTDIMAQRRQRNEALLFDSIGRVLKGREAYAASLEYYRKALAIQEKVRGTEHTTTAQSYNNIGLLLSDQGQHEQALEYHHKALAIQEKVLGTKHVDTAGSYNAVGAVLQKQGKIEEAFEHQFKALSIREKALATEHIRTAYVYANLGETMHAAGRDGEALDYHFKAL